jgi:hypothetical protein
MTTPALATLGQKIIQKKANQDAAYRQLVRSVAVGTEVDPDEVLAALRGFDKDYDEFAADVEKVAARKDLIDLAAQLPALTTRADQVAKSLSNADSTRSREVAAANAKWERTIAPLQDEERNIVSQLQAAQRAHDELKRGGCTDPVLSKRLAEVTARQRAANEILHPRSGTPLGRSPESLKAMVNHTYEDGSMVATRITELVTSGEADRAIAEYARREREAKAILAECERERDAILEEAARTL